MLCAHFEVSYWTLDLVPKLVFYRMIFWHAAKQGEISEYPSVCVCVVGVYVCVLYVCASVFYVCVCVCVAE